MREEAEVMARSESMARASKKYEKEKVDRVAFRVTKGKRELIQTHAASCNESVNEFLNRAVDEAIERDKAKAADNK